MNYIRLFVKQSLVQIPARGMKHKDVLQLRCDKCYFKQLDGRWHVLCDKFPRHKQIEKVERDKFRWIVSERSFMDYPAYKKRYMYPGHILE